jgi:hypothetical protein
MRIIAITLAATVIVLTAWACGDDDDEEAVPDGNASPTAELDPAEFSSTVDNPLFPLVPGAEQIYEGEDTDPETGETVAIRVESTVLSETHMVSGFEVAVVEVKEYEDGELVESTRDYYAQHEDGTVYYMGEDVDDYEDGEVVGHHGAWLHGQDGAQAGEFMPADPQAGDEFEQEKAPGIAEDMSTVVAVDQEVTVPAGTFSACIKTEDFDPLGPATEFKFYCPDFGLVREESDDSSLDLISY